MSDFSQRPFGFSDLPQNPFQADEFADNPEQRCPCLLLLDTSGSMGGTPIDELNEGLRAFKDDLMADSLARKRIEVAIMTFGPVRIEQQFVGAEAFQPPRLAAGGDTPMGAAIIDGIRLIEQRKERYRQHAIQYNRPWIFLMTDGAPTDDIRIAQSVIPEGIERKKFGFFAVGVQHADMNVLASLSPRAPLKLQGLKFRELFLWLSSSLGSASRSAPAAETYALPAPTGWAQF